MKPTTSLALAVIGIGSLAFALPLSVARAQEPSASTQAAPLAGPRGLTPTQQAEPGFPGDGRMIAPMPAQQMRGMGGGGATMVADGDSLYILQGNRLFKVNKGDLRVVREGMLPMNPPMQQGGRGEAPARAGGGGGQQPEKSEMPGGVSTGR